jgi:acyl carrier protein
VDERSRQDRLLKLLRRAVAQVAPQAQPERIREDSTLAELGLTSMEVLEVVAEMEDGLGVLLPEDLLTGEIETVGDLFALAQRHASAESGAGARVPGSPPPALPGEPAR